MLRSERYLSVKNEIASESGSSMEPSLIIVHHFFASTLIKRLIGTAKCVDRNEAHTELNGICRPLLVPRNNDARLA